MSKTRRNKGLRGGSFVRASSIAADVAFLGQDFNYSRKHGSMVECIEVFASDRQEWVHVRLDKCFIHCFIHCIE